MSTEERQAAQRRVTDLLAVSEGVPRSRSRSRDLIEETEALARAIAAFHLEGIRFRIYNVDRMVAHPPVPLPADAGAASSPDVRTAPRGRLGRSTRRIAPGCAG